MAPQLGTAITGGNATLGQGGALGGLGHFSLGLARQCREGYAPADRRAVRDASASPARERTAYRTKQSLGLPMPTVDGASESFEGFRSALTNVGGIDLLVSATYIPKVEQDDDLASIRTTPLKFGYGARVGILQESLVSPGVSVTYLKRDLPVLSSDRNVERLDASTSTNLDEKTTAWRRCEQESHPVRLRRRLSARTSTSPSATSATATISGHDVAGTIGPVARRSMTRTNMFADLSLNLLIFKLIGEIGQVSGGTAPSPYNTFPSKGTSIRACTARRGFGSSW